MAEKVAKSKFVSLPVYASVLLAAGIISGLVCHFAGCNDATSLACGAIVALIVPAVSVFFAAVFLALYLPIFIHEMGHFIAGHLVGFSFASMRVGCVQLDKSGRRWKLSIVRSALLIGGVTAMLPGGPNRLIGRMRIYTLGGIAASFLLLAALVIVNLRFGVSFSDYAHFEQVNPPIFVLEIFTILSFWCLVFSLIPVKKNDQMSDGARLLETVFNPAKTLVLAAQLRVGADLKQGIRARDWDREDIEIIRQAHSKNINGRPDLILYYYFLDRGELESAEILMEAARTYYQKAPSRSDYLTSIYLYEIAYIFAMRGRIAEAKMTLAESDMLGVKKSCQRKRALTAILAAEGNLEEAQKLAEETMRQLQDEGDLSKPNWQAEADWLQWALELAPNTN
ncbi:MAG TPA: site-2 protease family protein [Fimbriimonadaceae bacterium]|jgi:hypothetical protein